MIERGRETGHVMGDMNRVRVYVYRVRAICNSVDILSHGPAHAHRRHHQKSLLNGPNGQGWGCATVKSLG